MYRAFDIAKKFLELARKEGRTIDPMKLLKLIYIAHGFYMGMNKKPLISDRIEAWKFGPIIPDLYMVIKRFGSQPVDIEIIDLYAEIEISNQDAEFLSIVWEEYKDLTGLQLSTKTHQKNTPWAKSYIANGFSREIKNEIIQDYYSSFINKGESTYQE